ncbi:hypothetical protein E2C01_041058 [Portunus trituberculatus]|uniref:Uncharacterized protein n=1 Tax=Portunus trituberculatus TaxID=210409 RepID=A0A5B7FPA1_PORTR|nr:hypothetical protein [Portunus trituberculatus]
MWDVQHTFKVKPAIGQTARHCCHVSPRAVANGAKFTQPCLRLGTSDQELDVEPESHGVTGLRGAALGVCGVEVSRGRARATVGEIIRVTTVVYYTCPTAKRDGRSCGGRWGCSGDCHLSPAARHPSTTRPTAGVPATRILSSLRVTSSEGCAAQDIQAGRGSPESSPSKH